MWVFCCGMQRSGSTLQFQIAAHLVEEAGLGKRVEWVRPEEFPELRNRYAAYQGWKVFDNHVCTDEMAMEFRRQNAIGVYVSRDVRDTLASAMTKYAMTFDEMWRSGFLEDSLRNFRRWTSCSPMLVSKYEEMIRDLPREVERIATHLGIAIDRKRSDEIASAYAIDKQFERIEEARRRGKLRQGFDGGPLFDPHTNLHTDHIHSGGSGRWRTVLSPEQVALVEGRAEDWLRANGYELAFTSFQRTLLKVRYARARLAGVARRKLGQVLPVLRRKQAGGSGKRGWAK